MLPVCQIFSDLWTVKNDLQTGCPILQQYFECVGLTTMGICISLCDKKAYALTIQKAVECRSTKREMVQFPSLILHSRCFGLFFFFFFWVEEMWQCLHILIHLSSSPGRHCTAYPIDMFVLFVMLPIYFLLQHNLLPKMKPGQVGK